jgi:PAS domain S-box-containing protein
MSCPPLHILLIEDHPADADLLSEALAQAAGRFDVTHVTTMAAAIDRLRSTAFDAALVDLFLPDSHGIATLEHLVATAPHLPMVILTGLDDDALATEAIRKGAQDYLVKGDASGPLVMRAIRYARERKQAEEALRGSEQRYRVLVEGVDVGITLVDSSHNIVTANRKQAELVHRAPAELVGKKCYGEYEGRATVCTHCPGVKAMTSGRPVEIEITDQRKDGTTFAVRLKASPLFDQDGKATGFIEVVEDITESRQVQQALEKERHTLKHLLRSSDHERQLIAYEIHDGLAQQLAGAIMQLETYSHQKDTRPLEAARAFEAGMSMLQQGHFEARRLISGVRPPILDESGIVAAVAHLVNEQRLQKGPKIEYQGEVDFDRLLPILENAIYRIVQEGLANACKHSRSSRVRVELLQRGDELRIMIQDWGAGFDPAQVEEEHFGLAGIRERARLLGGKTTVESAPGHGTCITVELPLVLKD